MEIEVYRVSKPQQVPDGLFWALEGEDTRFIDAFENYPDTLQYVVATWSITRESEAYSEPTAALIATFDHIITGYIDLHIRPNPKGVPCVRSAGTSAARHASEYATGVFAGELPAGSAAPR